MATATETTATLAAKSLRSKILNVALTSPEFKAILAGAADEIRGEAKQDATEATIEGCFERVMYARLREIGLKFHPEKESAVELRRHVTRGRTDSRLGALVIEYKRPALLKTELQIDKAVAQLSDYLIALSKGAEGPFAGVLTNGLVIVELRARNGIVEHRSPAQKLDGAALLRLTQLFISLALTALTSENLIRDFCGSESDGILFQTARLLYQVLATKPEPKTEMLYSEWEQMFRLAHDDQSQQQRIEERRAALGRLFDVDVNGPVVEYRALFALHTAYAILLKFIAYRVVSDVYFGKVNQDFHSLTASSTPALRAFCGTLEDGDTFRQLGIVNLLEGDFFSWYSDKNQWTPALADSVRSVVDILARYEEANSLFASETSSDLFRELYQATVPRAVRSSFGEFYTPYWLAEHVIDSAIVSDDWRAIDPCCGSGTFVIAAITRLRREAGSATARVLLDSIFSRVVAVDLNPLGVLTTRINYFIHVCDLVTEAKADFAIPVFLGDAASIPERVVVGGVECLRYQLRTLRTPIDATLPVSVVKDTPTFVRLMQDYEHCVKDQDAELGGALLLDAIPLGDRSDEVRRSIERLTADLISLEKNKWNGIWARILSNFLTTACLGKFSAVIGNPPWIDWRNLPAGYRERVKSMCIDRGLFSGAGRTGGINLNICALIAHVSMSNWLDDTGRLAFLMPRELANQASYEGWRRLGKNGWKFLAFHDWSAAGHPFDPVKEDFMTFVIGKQAKQAAEVPVTAFKKVKDEKSAATTWRNRTEALRHLEITDRVAGQIIPGSTAFTFADDGKELATFSLVAGECEYIGRQGVEFYPQELFLFKYVSPGPRSGTAWFANIQVAKSKYKSPRRRVLLETKYLAPLVKGAALGTFSHEYDGLIVPFPYEASDPLRPISAKRLKEESPLLLAYYKQCKDILEKQTKYSAKLRGQDPGEFYGVPRTGPYCFAKHHVSFRDNTKWCAAVPQSTKVPWGKTAFVFQKHAVSMCERSEGEGFISKDEAHFICAILNTPIVGRFITASSDERSYNIRPPVFVPRYDPSDSKHRLLVRLSKAAHGDAKRHDDNRVEIAQLNAEGVYLSLCEAEARRDEIDSRIAQKRLAEIKAKPESVVSGAALEKRLAELDQ